MWSKWFWNVIDALVPRHRHAETARRTSPQILAQLMYPQTLAGATWVHTLFPYHDARVRAVIKATKYYGESDPALSMATLASDYVLDVLADKQALDGWSDIVVVPIPSSPTRLLERGYNQVELFAKPIAERLGAQYAPRLLSRTERTSQVLVARSRRKENILGAFTATADVRGQFVILIDDVVESGATLKDARRALLVAGAKDIIAIAMAH